MSFITQSLFPLCTFLLERAALLHVLFRSVFPLQVYSYSSSHWNTYHPFQVLIQYHLILIPIILALSMMDISLASYEDVPRLLRIFSSAYQGDVRMYFLYNSIEDATFSYGYTLRRVLSPLSPQKLRQIWKVTDLDTGKILGFLDLYTPCRRPAHGLPVAGRSGHMGLHLDEGSKINIEAYRFMSRKLQKELWKQTIYWRLNGFSKTFISLQAKAYLH
jgi:hypothetical protein